MFFLCGLHIGSLNYLPDFVGKQKNIISEELLNMLISIFLNKYHFKRELWLSRYDINFSIPTNFYFMIQRSTNRRRLDISYITTWYISKTSQSCNICVSSYRLGIKFDYRERSFETERSNEFFLSLLDFSSAFLLFSSSKLLVGLDNFDNSVIRFVDSVFLYRKYVDFVGFYQSRAKIVFSDLSSAYGDPVKSWRYDPAPEKSPFHLSPVCLDSRK